MVKEPLPSISSLSLDMSAYCCVVVAFTSPSVPYTWSMGATRGKGRWILHAQKQAGLWVNWNFELTSTWDSCKRDSYYLTKWGLWFEAPTCRASSHALQLHVPRTALIYDHTAKKGTYMLNLWVIQLIHWKKHFILSRCKMWKRITSVVLEYMQPESCKVLCNDSIIYDSNITEQDTIWM